MSESRLAQLLSPTYRGGYGFGEKAARNLESLLGIESLYFDLFAAAASSGANAYKRVAQSSAVGCDYIEIRNVALTLTAGDPDFTIQVDDSDGRLIGFRCEWFKARGFQRILQALNSNQVYAVLGLSLGNAVEDITNLASAAIVGGVSPLRMTQVLMDLHRPFEVAKEAEAKSGQLRARRSKVKEELRLELEHLTVKSKLAKGWDWMKDHSFVFMEFSDRLSSSLIWTARYRQGMAEHGDEKRAVTEADVAVAKVMPGFSAVDKAGLLRDKGYMGTVTRFYSFLNTAFNAVRNELHRFHTAEDGVEVAKLIVPVGARLLAYGFVVGVMSEFLRGRGPDGDEEWPEWLMRKWALGYMSLAPMGGDVGAMVESGILNKPHNPRAGPIASLGVDAYRAFNAFQSEDKTGAEKLGAYLNVAGDVMGVPKKPISSAVYWYELGTGEREYTDFRSMVRGGFYGQLPRKE